MMFLFRKIAISLGFVPAMLFAQNVVTDTLPIPADTPVKIADAATLLPPTFQQDFGLDRSSRMRVPVTVNAKGPFYFLVDTGSEATVISNELAAVLSLSPERRMRVASMTGTQDSPGYRIDNLQLNALVLRGLLAAGLDEKNLGAAGIIGIDTLQNHKVVFDFRNGTMDIVPGKRQSRRTEAKEGEIIVSATRRAGRLILSDATIAGRRVDLVIDTGAQSSVGNIALRDIMIARGKSRINDVVLSSVTGGFLDAQSEIIKQIKIGGMEFANIPVNYADGHAFRVLKLDKKPAMLLGMDALQLFDRIEVDFANRRVSFLLPAGGSRARRMDMLAAAQ